MIHGISRLSAPRPRISNPDKLAVLVTASAMPRLMARLFTRAMGSLRRMAKVVGARSRGELYIGLAARQPGQQLDAGEIERARRLGRRLGRSLMA